MSSKKSTSKKADGEMVIAHDESKAKKPEEPKLTGVEAYLAEEDPGSLPVETTDESPAEPEVTEPVATPEPEPPVEVEKPGLKPPSKRKKLAPVDPKDIPEPLPPSAFVPGVGSEDSLDLTDSANGQPPVVVPGGVAPSVPNPASFFRSHYKSMGRTPAKVLGMSPQTIVYQDPQLTSSAPTAQSVARHDSHKRLVIIILVTIISLIAFGVALYYWVYIPTQYFEG